MCNEVIVFRKGAKSQKKRKNNRSDNAGNVVQFLFAWRLCGFV
jgi:hypothetical protein